MFIIKHNKSIELSQLNVDGNKILTFKAELGLKIHIIEK